MRTKSRIAAAVVVVMAMVMTTAGVAHAADVQNGSFETGDFTGWTVESQPSSGGDVFVYSGNEHGAATPPCGTYAIVTDMDGPGGYVVYQDIVLEAGMTHELTFQPYYDNNGNGFVTPDPPTLDPFGDGANQQMRVDIMDPSADAFSVDPADVLENVFQTNPGDPDPLAPALVTVDLTAYAGQTIRFRFAETDNLGVFNASLDCVEIQSAGIPTTTTTSTTVAPTTTTTVAPTTTTAAAQPQALTPTFTG